MKGLRARALGLLLILMCAGVCAQTPPDDTPPTLIHQPDTHVVTPHQALVISAQVRDDHGVQDVTLFYRPTTTTNSSAQAFQARRMQRDGQSDRYFITLPAAEIVEPGIEYYLRAEDTSGNLKLAGYGFEPLTLVVARNKPVGEPPVSLEQRRQTDVSQSAHTLPSAAETHTKRNWHWWLVGAGVIAVALLARGSGDSNPDRPAEPSASLTISAPLP